jgi:uncharacterized membrane-anchored protein YitT (DUF2179 family)
MSSTVGERLQKSGREAICFEIITAYPNEISQEIIQKLHHTTTLIPAKGMYSGKETNVLICVINKHQLNDFQKILAKYTDTFSYFEVVNETYGNFKNIKQKA